MYFIFIIFFIKGGHQESNESNSLTPGDSPTASSQPFRGSQCTVWDTLIYSSPVDDITTSACIWSNMANELDDEITSWLGFYPIITNLVGYNSVF